MKNNIKLKYTFIALLLQLFLLTANAQIDKAAKAAWTFDFEKAEKYLNKAGSEGNDSLIAQLADVLYYQGKYPQALYYYKMAHNAGAIHLNSSKRNYAHAASLLKEKSPYYKQSNYFTHGYEIRAIIDTFKGNSRNEDFSAFYWNQIVFVTTSKPRAGTKNSFKYVYTQMPFLDVVCFNEKGREIAYPKFLPSNLNSEFHDGPISISADTSLLILAHNYKESNAQGANLLYLEYYNKNEKGKWGSPLMFNFCKSNYSVQHPFYNNATQTLYFSSNMPGGFGGFDLYAVKWDGKNWQTPENLGAEINSEYDEVFPAITPAGDLLYSSNHIETMGGLDFVIYKNGKRFLLGEPFNTVYDDFSLMFKNAKEGYFTSNRYANKFDDNIYHFYEPEQSLFVRIIDAETQLEIDSVLLEYKTVENAEPATKLVRSGVENILINDTARLSNSLFIKATLNGYEALEFVELNPAFKNGKLVQEISIKPMHLIAENKTYVIEKGADLANLKPVIENVTIGNRPINLDEVSIEQLKFPQHGNIKIDPLTGKPVISNNCSPGIYRFPVLISSKLYPKLMDTFMVEVEIPETDFNPNTKLLPFIISQTDTGFFNGPYKKASLVAADNLVVYFNNDEPRVANVKDYNYNYANAFSDYVVDFSNFYQKSIDDKATLDLFATSFLNKGYKDLDEALNLLISLVNQGNYAEIDLAAFCSPLAETDYNKQLAKRRILVVERYIQNWNNGALAEALKYKRIIFVSRVVGELEAPSSISNDVKQQDKSVYGVKTSLERRVNIIIKAFVPMKG